MFKCYSVKLANYLCKKGFYIKGSEPNYKKPQFDVFLFEDSQKLREAVDTYCRQASE